jgi:hypothetical protein
MVRRAGGELLRHARTATGLAVVSIALAGCGSGDDFANDPRPPTPINVTAAITNSRVSVSPQSIGAGPVVILIANETGKAHRMTVETASPDAPGVRQQTSPINPQGSGTLKLDMHTGSYKLRVDGDGIPEARLEVGKDRPSAQNAVLQP